MKDCEDGQVGPIERRVDDPFPGDGHGVHSRLSAE